MVSIMAQHSLPACQPIPPTFSPAAAQLYGLPRQPLHRHHLCRISAMFRFNPPEWMRLCCQAVPTVFRWRIGWLVSYLPFFLKLSSTASAVYKRRRERRNADCASGPESNQVLHYELLSSACTCPLVCKWDSPELEVGDAFATTSLAIAFIGSKLAGWLAGWLASVYGAVGRGALDGRCAVLYAWIHSNDSVPEAPPLPVALAGSERAGQQSC
ncbi:hypothetical protein IWX90DRAFT_244842 [Phyllosticta citrichinensis]|uniref:Uncharacterized protein n=1 Tax=Phyllosticta citrichinensis TaxID=1130410 RepID=A0ABR1XR28_9PEZI